MWTHLICWVNFSSTIPLTPHYEHFRLLKSRTTVKPKSHLVDYDGMGNWKGWPVLALFTLDSSD